MSEIKELSDEITEWRISNGFFTPSSFDTEHERDLMLGKLMLVSSEVGEAAEAVRNGDKQNFGEELADIVIRVMDISNTMGIDLSLEIKDKVAANKLRPFKHNRKCSL